MRYYIVRIKSTTYNMDFEPVLPFFHNNETTNIIKLSRVDYNVDVRYNLKN